MNIAGVKPILEIVSLDDEPIIQGKLMGINLHEAIFSIKPKDQENSRVPYAVLIEDDRDMDPYFKVCVDIKIINPEDIPHWILKNC